MSLNVEIVQTFRFFVVYRFRNSLVMWGKVAYEYCSQSSRGGEGNQQWEFFVLLCRRYRYYATTSSTPVATYNAALYLDS
jgi:hypothetical protein